MSYYPAKNLFTFQNMAARGRCSAFGDLCTSHQDCFPTCTMGTNAGDAVPLYCSGTTYEKARNMGKCYARAAQVGDACAIGMGPLPPSTTGNTCGPSLYCQQTLAADSQPNTAPSFAAPDVGQGYCMPVPAPRMRAYANML